MPAQNRTVPAAFGGAPTLLPCARCRWYKRLANIYQRCLLVVVVGGGFEHHTNDQSFLPELLRHRRRRRRGENEPVWAYMNEDSSNMVPASERLIAFTESVSASKNKHLGGTKHQHRHHIVSVSMALVFQLWATRTEACSTPSPSRDSRPAEARGTHRPPRGAHRSGQSRAPCHTCNPPPN